MLISGQFGQTARRFRPTGELGATTEAQLSSEQFGASIHTPQFCSMIRRLSGKGFPNAGRTMITIST